MKPSLSIVFFTVSSGAGLGLLALLALGDLFDHSLPSSALAQGIALALTLVAAGLAWLSREAVFAASLFPVALIFGALAWTDDNGPRSALAALGAVLLSWAVLVSTAMIYASLKPIRLWHSMWTPIGYLLLGHWSGAVLLVALARAHAEDEPSFGVLAIALGIAGLIAKIGHWGATRSGEGTAPTLERAIGVREYANKGARTEGMTVARARLFDVGHSHGTFLTHEFGFVLARRNAIALRVVALVAGLLFPVASIVSGVTNVAMAALAAIACLAGLLAERWLFFAEAQHTVRLYHGAPRT